MDCVSFKLAHYAQRTIVPKIASMGAFVPGEKWKATKCQYLRMGLMEMDRGHSSLIWALNAALYTPKGVYIQFQGHWLARGRGEATEKVLTAFFDAFQTTLRRLSVRRIRSALSTRSCGFLGQPNPTTTEGDRAFTRFGQQVNSGWAGRSIGRSWAYLY